ELRRRSRRPRIEADPDGTYLAELHDPMPEPSEAAWQAYRREAVRNAVEALPPPQRQALGLAFFEDLTHEQVASVLNLPLGTAKTRIRDGLQKLRGKLAPLSAVLTVVILALLGVRYRAERLALQRDERALALVTASDAGNIRLAPAPGIPADTHARYRGRA